MKLVPIMNITPDSTASTIMDEVKSNLAIQAGSLEPESDLTSSVSLEEFIYGEVIDEQ